MCCPFEIVNNSDERVLCRTRRKVQARTSLGRIFYFFISSEAHTVNPFCHKVQNNRNIMQDGNGLSVAVEVLYIQCTVDCFALRAQEVGVLHRIISFTDPLYISEHVPTVQTFDFSLLL